MTSKDGFSESAKVVVTFVDTVRAAYGDIAQQGNGPNILAHLDLAKAAAESIAYDTNESPQPKIEEINHHFKKAQDIAKNSFDTNVKHESGPVFEDFLNSVQLPGVRGSVTGSFPSPGNIKEEWPFNFDIPKSIVGWDDDPPKIVGPDDDL
ncbi:hypothetical protein ABC383_28010 [Noviherbaspirillum sp. 1P10PC]|uniref:hypothetical protein n=1 Tax=Noviherbaspirillum sp. 1P10PC TaxID=3132292 RepID=UPI0039A3CC1A